MSMKVKKRRATRIAKSKEGKLVASASTRRFLAQKGWGASLGLSRSTRRSDPLVDCVALEYLDRKLALGGQFGLTAVPPRLVPVRPTSELNRLKRWGQKYSLARKARHALSHIPSESGSRPRYLIHVPHWGYASEVWKTLAYMTCIPVGHRITFNLNLTHDIALRALQSKRGPTKYLQARIATELRASFPGQRQPDFMMVLECVGDGWGAPDRLGLHVHGVLYAPFGEQTVQSPRQIMQRIKNALRRAGGKFSAATIARQLLSRSALNTIGWTAYLYKQRHTTSLAIQNAQRLLGMRPGRTPIPLLAATAGLRAQAQRWYAARRGDQDLIWVARKKVRSVR